MNEVVRVIPLSLTDISPDSSFSIVLRAPQKALIIFSAIVYSMERDFNLSDPVTVGVVKQNETQFFTFDLEELLLHERQLVFSNNRSHPAFTSNFIFNLIPSNGDPDLYIHYGETRPALITNFDWQSHTNFR